MQPSWRPDPGTILGGRYTLERQVGVGPTSAVYAARDSAAGDGATLVAVKVFHPAFFSSRRRGPNTMRIQRARAYSHAGLIPVRDVQIGEGEARFVVTDFLSEALPLERWILGRMPLATEQVRELMGPIADAVEAVHMIGVAGNLMPSNVFVADDGSVVISDPWYLDGRDDVGPGELPERSGHWLAPEQRGNDWTERPETDVYRLGLMLGWLMAGRTVVGGRSLIRQRVMVPQSVDGVFVKATTSDPAERYPDVAAFRAALAAAWTAEDWDGDDEQEHDTVMAVVEAELPLVEGESAEVATTVGGGLAGAVTEAELPAGGATAVDATAPYADAIIGTGADTRARTIDATAPYADAITDMPLPGDPAAVEAAVLPPAIHTFEPVQVGDDDEAASETVDEEASGIVPAAIEALAADAELITDFEIIEESVVGPLGEIIAQYGPGAPDSDSVPALPIDHAAIAAGVASLDMPDAALAPPADEPADSRIGSETEAIPLDEIMAMGLDPRLENNAEEVAAVVYPAGVTESVDLDEADVVELVDSTLVMEEMRVGSEPPGAGAAPVLMDLAGPGAPAFDPSAVDSTRTVQVVPGPGSARALEAARVADGLRRAEGTTSSDLATPGVAPTKPGEPEDDERRRSAIVWIAPLLVVIAAFFMFWVLGEVSKRRQAGQDVRPGTSQVAAGSATTPGTAGATGGGPAQPADAAGTPASTAGAAAAGPGGPADAAAGGAATAADDAEAGGEEAGKVTGEAVVTSVGDATGAAPADAGEDGAAGTSADAGPVVASQPADAGAVSETSQKDGSASEAAPEDPEIPEDMAREDYSCPRGMARIRGNRRFKTASGEKVKRKVVWCVDRHEYPGKGSVPQTNVSLGQARGICKARGRRLCTKAEWRGACGGKYPYRGEYDPGRCNTVGSDGMPRPVLPAGSRPACKGGFGTYDMVGNVAEWTSDGAVNGGSAYKDGESASCYRSGRRTGGSPYVGFRCCADPIPKVKDPAADDKE